ncbi:MAG: YihY/virulence factor BrkB family protein [Planctomycetaceae bacterium]
MVRKHLQRALHWIGHVIRQPWEELNRWQRAARFAYDLSRHGAVQLREDRAPQMAAALAFQTLFALVPVLVVVMFVVQAFTTGDEFARLVHQMLEWGGLSDVSVTLPAGVDAETHETSLQTWLAGLIGDAANTNLQWVGWIGFAVIVYSAISMLVTIETSFNTVYRAPAGRPWSRRVPLYWFLITISPAAIYATAMAHRFVAEWAGTFDQVPWFVPLSHVAWSLSIGWLFWFVVYSLVPNTTVSWQSSAIGALVCALLLEVAKRSLGAYLSNAFSINHLYGSLGTVPLFMFWVYLMWLFILFGLEVRRDPAVPREPHAGGNRKPSRNDRSGRTRRSRQRDGGGRRGFSRRLANAARDCRPHRRARTGCRQHRSGTV